MTAHDHQCQATRAAQQVIVALLCELRKDMTTAGHLAQRVTHEHMGYCGVKGESPLCTGRWGLLAAGVAWIDAYAVDQTVPAAKQLSMLSEAIG